jgi:glycosyltransferase involved in cell wall biosynthesis
MTQNAESPRTGQRLRIGLVHRFDARNIRTWNGIFYFMCRALEAHVGEVVYLGPDSSAGTRRIEHYTALLNRVAKKIANNIVVTENNRLLALRLARVFERRLKQAPCDILFAPFASTELAFLKTDVPIVYCSDITWPLILNHYPDLANISAFTRNEAFYIESRSVQRATACTFPSEWAAESSCEDFGSAPESTYRIHFGANLISPPKRAAAVRRSLQSPIKLLMVGMDWKRKGGPIAFECLNSLLENGVDASLTLCGSVPPPGFEHPRFRVIPFLNKSDPQQWKEFEQLYFDAHFMLFPTRADALGLVLCEASAYGLPVLATDTGGVRGALNDGVNGFAMPYEARGDAYAAKIMAIIAEPSRYQDLVVSSRDEYERCLNWDAWGVSIRNVMERVLGRTIDAGVTSDPSQMAIVSNAISVAELRTRHSRP